MDFWRIDPGVVELGLNTKMDTTEFPPVVSHLHVDFTGWGGSALLQCFPVFVVTRALSDALVASGLTGARMADVEVTLDEQCRDLLPRPLPEFVWMQVGGEPFRDDVAVGDDHRLVVSQRALDLLLLHGLPDCTIERAYPG